MSDKPCPRCGGTGKIVITAHWAVGDFSLNPCPDCGGTGCVKEDDVKNQEPIIKAGWYHKDQTEEFVHFNSSAPDDGDKPVIVLDAATARRFLPFIKNGPQTLPYCDLTRKYEDELKNAEGK